MGGVTYQVLITCISVDKATTQRISCYVIFVPYVAGQFEGGGGGYLARPLFVLMTMLTSSPNALMGGMTQPIKNKSKRGPYTDAGCDLAACKLSGE